MTTYHDWAEPSVKMDILKREIDEHVNRKQFAEAKLKLVEFGLLTSAYNTKICEAMNAKEG